MTTLKVDILKVSNLSIGKIATIKFPPDNYPVVAMVVEANEKRYKITGVVLTSQPADSIINQNREKNIFECKIEDID